MGELVGPPIEPDELHDLTGLGEALGLRPALDLETVRDVVENRAVGEEREVLEHHRHALAANVTQAFRGGVSDAVFADGDGSACRLQQPVEHADEGRLSRTGETHDDEDLADANVERCVDDSGGTEVCGVGAGRAFF